MDHYTIMLVVDATAPVRRFQVRRVAVRRAVIGAGLAILLAALALWDLWHDMYSLAFTTKGMYGELGKFAIAG